MSNRGNFYAVGKRQWDKACHLGINAAVAFPVFVRRTVHGRVDDAATSCCRERDIARTAPRGGTGWQNADAGYHRDPGCASGRAARLGDRCTSLAAGAACLSSSTKDMAPCWELSWHQRQRPPLEPQVRRLRRAHG